MKIHNILTSISPSYINSSVSNFDNIFDSDNTTSAILGLYTDGREKIKYNFPEPIVVERIEVVKSSRVYLDFVSNGASIRYSDTTVFPIDSVTSLSISTDAGNFSDSRLSSLSVLVEIQPINKTLILHDGEYKKWNNRADGSNIIPIMTSDTTPFGVARASGYASDDTKAWKAFNGIYTGTSVEAWVAVSATGAWLSYEFNANRKVIEYGIRCRNDSNGIPMSPTEWYFEGSNNNIDWIELDYKTNITWQGYTGEERKYKVNNNEYFRCYRIRIIKNNGHANNYHAISELKMYEEKKEGNWSTVSSTRPSKDQFLSDGMDSLTPLLDRRVETLEPLEMMNKSDILQTGEEGKVFSKTIDLEKYLDIRSVKVKVE